jgi:hypothetical protein
LTLAQDSESALDSKIHHVGENRIVFDSQIITSTPIKNQDDLFLEKTDRSRTKNAYSPRVSPNSITSIMENRFQAEILKPSPPKKKY